MKKFENEDIVRNVIKTHPRIRFFCYNGKVYYNNKIENGVVMNDFLFSNRSVYDSFLLEDGFLLLNEDGTYLVVEG